MVLGIGRGDSAVQRIGKESHSLAGFERYLGELQQYLRGEVVKRDGFESRLEWLRFVRQPKVPVCVAATGPKVIELAAQHADAVIFAVGAAATFARFSAFKGSPVEQLPEPRREAVAFLRERFARAMEESFIDRFALAGQPDHVLPRFEALARLGLDFLYMVSASGDTPREIARTSLDLISREVLPVLHAR